MKTIHHVVDIGAKIGQVFEAITTQEGLAGWWSTEVTAPSAELGAVIDFTFGGDFNPDMEITAVEPGRRVEWTCVGGHDKWADNRFVFELAPLNGGRTRLRFWQHYAVELDDDDYGTYNFNWAYYLQSLLQLATTGTGKPFDPAGQS